MHDMPWCYFGFGAGLFGPGRLCGAGLAWMRPFFITNKCKGLQQPPESWRQRGLDLRPARVDSALGGLAVHLLLLLDAAWVIRLLFVILTPSRYLVGRPRRRYLEYYALNLGSWNFASDTSR
jgi:hypothetical protein